MAEPYVAGTGACGREEGAAVYAAEPSGANQSKHGGQADENGTSQGCDKEQYGWTKGRHEIGGGSIKRFTDSEGAAGVKE